MNTRIEILIKKVFLCEFTWDDLEDFFCKSKNILAKELEDFLSSKPNKTERERLFQKKIRLNEKKIALLNERA